MAKVYLETYGCTLNQADSDIMRGMLEEAGHEISGEAGADVIIVNTCTVKGVTENKILERLRRLHAAGRKVVVAGCMAAARDRVAKAAPKAPVVWPSAVSSIAAAVEDAMAGRLGEHACDDGKGSLQRAFTKPVLRIPIGEGCTSNCHFCQTKLARPKLRSLSKSAIISWISEGMQQEAREIQLTAMDSGVYGMDCGTDLPSLMECINGMDGKFLTRLGMINPQHAVRMQERLLEQLAGPKFYRFIHVPVQSGSEDVVKAMGRLHTVADFESFVEAARKRMPDISIATDIIAGYPTETEKDFQETLELLERVKPDIVNVSKFSPRPGTEAKMLKQLPTQEIKERSRRLSALCRKISEENNRKLTGSETEVLITERQRDFTGRSPCYRQVVVKGDAELGKMMKVRITDANHGCLFGEVSR